MRSNFFLSLLKALKLPLKLLVGWLEKKPKRTKTEQERKLLVHVRNFVPKHYSWQKSIGCLGNWQCANCKLIIHLIPNNNL